MISARIAGYKANIQKPIAFLYTSKEQVEFEIKNTISFILALPHKILKYKSNKCVQDLYEENYKTLMNKIKELNKWRDISCSWIQQLSMSRC